MRLSGKGCSHHKGVYVCVRGNWSQELAKNSLLVVIGDFAKEDLHTPLCWDSHIMRPFSLHVWQSCNKIQLNKSAQISIH